ncbi:MAG: cytochrome P450 [Polyangiales bacterium]
MDDVQELPYDQRPANRDLGRLDGEYGWPLVGKTLAMVQSPNEMFRRHFEKYGEVSRISITGNKCVLLLHPDHAQRVLLDREKNFSIKKGWESVMADFFEGGLVMRDYDEHRLHRGIMQSSFKPDAMRGYLTRIQVIVRRAVERWAKKDEFVFYDEVKRLLLEIAFDVFCWVEDSGATVRKANQAFTDMMEGALGIVRLPIPGLLYHRGIRGRATLKRFFMDLIAQKRASSDQDVFAHFCRSKTEDGAYYADEDIADHMVFLMLAAHDTTTSAATMAAYYLCHDFDLQERIGRDVPRSEAPLSYEAFFHEMKEMVGLFYETIRLHPPVSVLLRRTIRECEFGGHRVPADTMVCVPSTFIHRHPGFWDEPDQFDHTRFSEERNEQRKHNFMWIPFGGGAHKCIGMHFARLLFMETFAEMMTGYRLEFTRRDYYPAKLQYFPFSKPTDGLPMRLVAHPA